MRGDFRTTTGAVTIITAGEVFLARAEAASLGWTSEEVATLYLKGITASNDQWGLAAPTAAYINNTPATIANITVQRWIASYPDGHQAWNVWRKSATAANPKGYPALNPAPDAVNASKLIVSRFVYPTSEYSSNEANVNASVARTGGDTQDTHVWWDVEN
jgi:hypothetical protein